METIEVEKQEIEKPVEGEIPRLAFYIKQLVKWKADAHLFQMVPPLDGKYKYIAISSLSAAFDTGLPETMVFECDSEGNTDFMDIREFKGCLTYENVLTTLGYKLVNKN
jgi:hypothetical protein